VATSPRAAWRLPLLRALANGTLPASCLLGGHLVGRHGRLDPSAARVGDLGDPSLSAGPCCGRALVAGLGRWGAQGAVAVHHASPRREKKTAAAESKSASSPGLAGHRHVLCRLSGAGKAGVRPTALDGWKGAPLGRPSVGGPLPAFKALGLAEGVGVWRSGDRRVGFAGFGTPARVWQAGLRQFHGFPWLPQNSADWLGTQSLI